MDEYTKALNKIPELIASIDTVMARVNRLESSVTLLSGQLKPVLEDTRATLSTINVRFDLMRRDMDHANGVLSEHAGKLKAHDADLTALKAFRQRVEEKLPEVREAAG